MTVSSLTVLDWTLLLTGALLVGFAKTAAGGVGAIGVVIFAGVLPARESTGAILPLLLLGDLVAVRAYHRHADWGVLARLLPGVLPGLLLGAVFVATVDDAVMRRSIGLILLLMTAMQLWMRRPSASAAAPHRVRAHPHVALTQLIGAAAGFATMTANAGGPVTTLYLLVAGLPMLSFLGTAAWFYLLVNAAKVPFSAGLSLISVDSLLLDALLVPAMLLGAAVGVATVRRINQAQFELAVLAVSAPAAALLLLNLP